MIFVSLRNHHVKYANLGTFTEAPIYVNRDNFFVMLIR